MLLKQENYRWTYENFKLKYYFKSYFLEKKEFSCAVKNPGGYSLWYDGRWKILCGKQRW